MGSFKVKNARALQINRFKMTQFWIHFRRLLFLFIITKVCICLLGYYEPFTEPIIRKFVGIKKIIMFFLIYLIFWEIKHKHVYLEINSCCKIPLCRTSLKLEYKYFSFCFFTILSMHISILILKHVVCKPHYLILNFKSTKKLINHVYILHWSF